MSKLHRFLALSIGAVAGSLGALLNLAVDSSAVLVVVVLLTHGDGW